MRKLSKYVTIVLAVVAWLAAAGIAQADQTVAHDDWNDADWISTVPGTTWSLGSGSNSTISIKKRQGPIGTNADWAVRWKPKKKNPTTPSMTLSGLGGTESAGWVLEWDERWYDSSMPGTSGQVLSQSYVRLDVSVPTLGGGTTTGDWTLYRASPDAGGRSTIIGTVGGTQVYADVTLFPGGFDPVQDQYLRYRWSRDLYSSQMTLTATELDGNGNPTAVSYLLADFDSTLYGEITAGGSLIDDAVELNAIEYGALDTEDGYDANADNLTLTALETGRPANLDAYVNVNNYASLADAIANEDYIYLPPGAHYVDNPITITRATPLFLFGAGKLNKTEIRAMNPTQPLFIVNKATHIGVAAIEFWTTSDTVTDPRTFRFDNVSPLRFEAQSSSFYRYTVEVGGPGVFVFQACLFNGKFTGNTDALVVDDPGAEVYVVGSFAGSYQRSFVHLAQGHLEVYGSGIGFIGMDDTDPLRADFRIDSASPKTAHVIAGVRSEGTKMQHASPFLRVPSTSSPVDVVLKGNISTYKLAQSPLISDPGPIVDYNGTGTLWMVGHVGRHTSAESLVAGSAPGATIVAIGNQFEGGTGTPPAMLPVTGATEYFAANIYDHEHSADPDDSSFPHHRFVNPTATLSPSTPPIPKNAHNGAIPKLGMPTINSPAPTGLLVDVVAVYGADPADNANDDWPEIQAALDAEGPNLYFPPGIYNLSQPLVFHKSGTPYFAAGGMFAGAGADVTVIKADAGVGTVFSTEGMAYTTWQGITFEVPEVKAAAGSTFEIENTTGVGDSSTENDFYDCKFVGGRYAFSLGLTTPTMSDITLMVDSEFRDAVVGFANGSFNALNNYVHGGRFVNNDYAIGSPLAPLNSGGTWGVLSATMTGTAIDDLHTRNNVQKLYHNRIVSDGNSLSQSLGWTTHPGSLFFDECSFDPPSPATPDYLSYTQGGGVTFLHSTVTDGHQRYTLTGSQKFVLSLHSDITTWSTIQLDTNSQKYELP